MELGAGKFGHYERIRLMIAMGTQFYRGDAESEKRQSRARASLLELDGVIPINLQFVDETFEPAGFRTLRVLRQHSGTITRSAGARKPVVSEMFGALAQAARTHGCRYFAYINADIEVTPGAVAQVLAGNRAGYAFSRIDLDPVTRRELGVQIFGLDMFAIDAAWWARDAGRFRPYLAGEGCWDNVYASILCAHADGDVVNENSGIYHEAHPTAWNAGPCAEHNGYLAALDAPYFSRWVQYATALDAARRAGTHVDRRALLLRTLADARLSAAATVVQAGRQLKARTRHAWRRARGTRS